MTEKKFNYSPESFPENRLPVGIDFSKMDIINLPTTGGTEGELRKEIKAELVKFSRTDKIKRPAKSTMAIGSFVTREQLQAILRKDRRDRSYFKMLDYCRKYDKQTTELCADFDLLRDFFPSDLLREVEQYCLKIISKIEQKVKEQGNLKLTPRKRRGFVLAILRSHCRRNGRKFPKELLEEINDRFNYTKRIKPFEICKAEKELIDWNFLAKTAGRETEDIRIFYLNVINNINRLKRNPTIAKSKEKSNIVSQTQKYINNFATNKEQRKALVKVVKHQDKDFIARLIIWTIAKHFAKKEYNLIYREPEKEPGWKELFLVENLQGQMSEGIPIRSFKFIFWASFHLRKKLREIGLFPEEETEENEKTN